MFLTAVYVLLTSKTYLPHYLIKALSIISITTLYYLKLHYFTLNTSLTAVTEVSVNTNELLTNNLNKIHPAILYLTVISAFTNITLKLRFFSENKVQLNSIILTLTLGA